ncbi:MAG: TAXI family TRAP transporter solute-binding subunit [Burkholderiales bacterium]
MRKIIILAAALLTGVVAFAADKSVRLSISTGGTAGVYYPLGGGMAAVLSKYVPEIEATAEVTGGSVDNIKLIGAGKSDVGFSMADAAWDGYKGQDKFKEKVPLRTLLVLYPNPLQIATVEGSGIEKISDLKGKRVSTGAAGSGTEIMAMRLLRAYGLDPDKDVTRDRLSLAESVNAIKDKKIDALFWSGGLPTAGLTDLGATPNVKMKLIDHGDAADAMRKTYGSLYMADTIPAKTYPGQEKDVSNVTVWNLLVASEKMSDKVAYDIVKTLFEKKPELVAVHKDARHIELRYQASGSPVPFHPGALKYLKEQGIVPKE